MIYGLDDQGFVIHCRFFIKQYWDVDRIVYMQSSNWKLLLLVSKLTP